MTTKIASSYEYVYVSNYIYIILGMFRPGALTFLTKLEYEYFPPSEDINDTLNDLFTVHIASYEGNTYSIIGVPMEYLDKCRQLADSIGLQLINGYPMTANKKDSLSHFPISHSQDLTYTVQNTETLDPKTVQAKIQKELIQVRKYLYDKQNNH